MERRLVNEAVDWYVRMHDGAPSAVTRTQFTDWLLLSPEHIRVFLVVTQSIEPLSNAASDLDRERLVAGAMADRQLSNVVPLEGVSPVPTSASANQSRASRIKAAWIVGIACGALGVGALCGWFACDHWHHTQSIRDSEG
jgi:transmembrane sensor